LLESTGTDEPDQSHLIESLRSDYRNAKLNTADRSMLDYAVKLTRTPEEISNDDVGLLRKVGFDDRGIHDICAITAYYAFVNRIANGLGVELEGTSV